ncbi:hypothetical protein PsorP6_018107 [Peronosclerospora sorghi]|uniref:Uncharacterized protein n=1 Tax=Peronosclerospora sorghi TaxID=230839 RepID=A0ACC0WCB4_9STRA|nr:hypothetical protein PsorP6_018107 [Peronosclerospora sorghi]
MEEAQLCYMYVPKANILSTFGSEVVFPLPAASEGMFSTMLEAFDEGQQRLIMDQYGNNIGRMLLAHSP